MKSWDLHLKKAIMILTLNFQFLPREYRRQAQTLQIICIYTISKCIKKYPNKFC
jgi:hypothetical protein